VGWDWLGLAAIVFQAGSLLVMFQGFTFCAKKPQKPWVITSRALSWSRFVASRLYPATEKKRMIEIMELIMYIYMCVCVCVCVCQSDDLRRLLNWNGRCRWGVPGLQMQGHRSLGALQCHLQATNELPSAKSLNPGAWVEIVVVLNDIQIRVWVKRTKCGGGVELEW